MCRQVYLVMVLGLSVSLFPRGGRAKEWNMPKINWPKAPQHPLVACTPKELKRLRAAYTGRGATHIVVAKKIHRAETALREPLTFPPRGGQHNQWYQCDKCQLALKTLDATHHQCPRCKKIYSGAPYDDVLFSHQHGRNLTRMSDAAWAHAITGEKKYAAFAARVLLGYAERYLKYPYHDNRRRRGKKASRSGGRLLEQTLGEASSLALKIAPSFDLIHDALSAAERTAIRDQLIRPMLENMDKHKAGKSNWQSWHNAAMLWGGAALGEAKWVRKALTQRGNGFGYQMRHSVSADGMWYENSWGYHFYTLSALVALAEGARRLKIDLWSHPAFKKMFALPVHYTMADGSLPRFGDAVQSSARGAADRMEAAFHAYRDPALLALLPKQPNWRSILLGRDTARIAPKTVLKSGVFQGAGHAILRTKGRAGLTAALTFGPFGGFHGHFDKLSFVFFGFKKELGVDPGHARSQAYRLPIHHSWYRATISHNAVVVDKAPQGAAAGKLVAFAANERYAAVAARCDEAYPGVQLRRWLVMTPSYLVVCDDLSSEKKRRFDWWYHQRGQRAVCSAASKKAVFEKSYAGAEYVQKVKAGLSAKAIRARFEAKNLTTHLTLDAQPNTRVLIGDGVGASIEDRVPLVMFTRRGQRAHFAAVLEPVRKGAVPKVEEIVLVEEKGALVIRVVRGAGTDRLQLGPKGALSLESGGQVVLATK